MCVPRSILAQRRGQPLDGASPLPLGAAIAPLGRPPGEDQPPHEKGQHQNAVTDRGRKRPRAPPCREAFLVDPQQNASQLTDGETPADAEICRSGYPVTNVAQLSHRRPSAAGAQVACPSQGWPSVAKAGSSRERRRCAWAAGRRRRRPRWPRGALPRTPLLSAPAHAPNPELAGAGKPSPQELPGWGVRAIRPQEWS